MCQIKTDIIWVFYAKVLSRTDLSRLMRFTGAKTQDMSKTHTFHYPHGKTSKLNFFIPPRQPWRIQQVKIEGRLGWHAWFSWKSWTWVLFHEKVNFFHCLDNWNSIITYNQRKRSFSASVMQHGSKYGDSPRYNFTVIVTFLKGEPFWIVPLQ